MSQHEEDLVGPAVHPVEFGELGESQPDGERQKLEFLLDVRVPITVEVGSTKMTLEEILDLVPGSVVRLDKRADDPVDLRVNGCLVARGEVVMVDDDYGLRITRIVDSRERLRGLRSDD
ncbi:MAG: flagellar motor switch protein FliN [Planctomycetota bacterium]